MIKRGRNVAITLMLTGFLAMPGCSQPKSEPVAEVEQNAVEKDYLRLLADLTSIMEAPSEDPVQNLDALRKYVESSRKSAAGMIKAFNKDVLAMQPDDREKWRNTARPRVEEALEKFAEAQLALKSRLNDAQKWELNEILALLRS